MSRAEERALGRGFLAGIFWGALVSVAIVFVSNFALDRRQLSFPRPEAVPVEVPAGSEFDQAREETDPVVPEVETRPGGEALSGVAPPPDAVETPPTFDTSSLEVPQPTIAGPDGLGEVPEIAEEVEIDVTGPGPSSPVQPLTNNELEVPDAPTSAPKTSTEAPAAGLTPPSEDTGPVGEEIAGLAPTLETPSLSGEVEAPRPGGTTAAPAPEAEAPAAETAPPSDTETAAAPEAPESPSMPTLIQPSEVIETPSGQGIIIVDGGDSSSFFQPVEGIGNRAPEVETDRLPRIGSVPEVAPDAPIIRRGTENPEAPAVEEVAAPEPDAAPMPTGPAIETWNQPFAAEVSQPLFSLVLVHQGEAMPDTAMLASLPETVSFAVDASLGSAGDIAAAYRAAGREVVMIPALPEGATPQDVEVALRVNMETVPEAVAVMDASGEKFQSDRAAVAQLVDVVTASGHGLITFPRGLNTAHQRAQREGVPAGLIFRDIDGDGQTDEQIRRAMDRAAFRARIDRPVILVGQAKPLTFEAIPEWSLGARAASVTLAPVSAALLASPS